MIKRKNKKQKSSSFLLHGTVALLTLSCVLALTGGPTNGLFLLTVMVGGSIIIGLHMIRRGDFLGGIIIIVAGLAVLPMSATDSSGVPQNERNRAAFEQFVDEVFGQ